MHSCLHRSHSLHEQGSAISMPWIDSIAGLVLAWYSGNEVGNAIADVLFGKVNPSGKMPLTFPKRFEDIPAFPNLTSENGQIHYREDLYVGYKHYQAKNIEPLFPFGYVFPSSLLPCQRMLRSSPFIRTGLVYRTRLSSIRI